MIALFWFSIWRYHFEQLIELVERPQAEILFYPHNLSIKGK